MLRRKISNWASKPDDPRPFCAFPESFWQYYQDSLSRSTPKDLPTILPTNTKKYHSNSSTVNAVKQLFGLDLPQPSTSQVISVLKSPFTQGDVVKAYHLIRYFQLSDTGYFITNDGHDRLGAKIELVGAENWENVMCYLDALLFSMFANLELFEPILFILNQHANPLVTQLSGLLRVYVNLLRLGNLITTDITQRICECLMKLGFSEAMSHRQQDLAPVFEFLTETLAMPLLTFRVEIQHLGKQDDDDKKYLKERILFVSLPEDDDSELVKPENSHVEVSEKDRAKDGESSKDPLNLDSSKDLAQRNGDSGTEPADDAVLLEECLEHYFNNSISVRRELQRRATLDTKGLPGGDVPVVTEGEELNMAAEVSDTQRNNASTRQSTADSTPQVRVRTRLSTLSIWSISSVESKPREVMLPAWMLLRLLPFYTDDNDLNGANESIARNSREFANRRPVLPICLKRYSFSAGEGLASRSKRRILIPPIIDLPAFVADDPTSSDDTGYKLILESAVCHRGTTIQSGHFVSAVRKDNHIENQTLEEALAAPWYLYDDLKKHRVVTKTFQEIFDTEWPYMLFYRLLACEGTRPNSQVLSVLSLNVSPVIAPKGFKQKYWVEELTPIASDGGDTSMQSLELLPKNQLHLTNSTTSSIPIPEYLPSNPKFVDIRKRYLWYVIDKDKNYYKELASISKTGSRNMSISFTPQFRRNSQWSDISNISGFALEEDTNANLEKVREKLETFDHKEHEDVVSPILSEKSRKSEEKHRHLHHIFSHDAPPSFSKKEYRKKRTQFKKEKCCIV